MKSFKEKLAKLIDLKTFLTIGMIGTFLYICVISNIKITSEQFVPLVVMILTFYFAKTSKDKFE